MVEQDKSAITLYDTPKDVSIANTDLTLHSLQVLDEVILWEPEFLEKSAWTSHIPFAFWLIKAINPGVFVELGTHHGTSYFAFCQAVAKARLDTRCFAIDSWEGDKHAGYYGDEVYNAAVSYNSANYSGFSSLIRSSFAEAVHQFSDQSIDLLHIDGLHTYEAVKSDFETWHRKLSERAIVVFHDTNERRSDFGVWRLYEELSATYPAFEFVHGHGLGILGIGSKLPSAAEALFESTTDAQFSQHIRRVFSQLGKNCVDRSDSLNKKRRNSKLEAQVEKRDRTIEKQSQQLSDLDNKSRERIGTLEQEIVEKSNQLDLQKTVTDDHIERLERELARQEADFAQAREKISELTLELEKQPESDLIESTQQEIDRLKNELVEKESRIGDVQRSIEESTKALGDKDNEIEYLKGVLDDKQSMVMDVERRMEENAKTLDERDREIESLKSGLADNELRVTDAERRAEDRAHMLAEKEMECSRLENRLKERFEEIATLTKMLEGKDQKIEGPDRLVGKAIGQVLHGLCDPGESGLVPGRFRMRRKLARLKQTGMFDPEWYREHYEDIKKAGVDPSRHYLEFGWREGRLPNGNIGKTGQE